MIKFIYLIIFCFVLIFNLNHLENKLQNSLNKFLNETKEENDVDCDWVFLEPRIYFKRQSSFFFSDVSLISLSFISFTYLRNLKIGLLLHLNNRKKKIFKIKMIKNIKIDLIYNDNYNQLYAYYNLISKFNIEKYLIKYNWKMEDIYLEVEVFKQTKFKSN